MKADVRLLKWDCPNCKIVFDKLTGKCTNCGIEFVEHYL